MFNDKNEQTPLWLNLKKEYIDDNLDSLVKYLRDWSLSPNKDSFYDTTVSLMTERVNELIEKYSTQTIYERPDSDDVLEHNIKLIAAFLLANPSDELRSQAYLVLMHLLMTLTPKFSMRFMNNARQCLCHASISSFGFNWRDIVDYSPEVFAMKATDYAAFTGEIENKYFERYGTAILSNKGLMISDRALDDTLTLTVKGADSLSIDGLSTLRTSVKDKLKQSQENSLVDMYNYVSDFCTTQKNVRPEAKVERLMTYSNGDEAPVRITNIDYRTGSIQVKTIDPNFEPITGEIIFNLKAIQFFYKEELSKMLRVGNLFFATIDNVIRGEFTISEQLTKFMVDECESIQNSDDDLIAAVMYRDNINNDTNVWIAANGATVYIGKNPDYGIGDYAWIYFTDFKPSDKYKHLGIVNICGEIDNEKPVDNEDKFDRYKARKDFLDCFGYSAEPIMENQDPERLSIDETTLRLVMRMMFTYQHSLLKPGDRFRYLMNARAIATLLGDETNDSYLRFAGSYLMILVQFARDETINALTLTPDEQYKDAESTRARMLIVDLLKRYGNHSDTRDLDDVIDEYEKKMPAISRLARLIQAANTLSGTLNRGAINIIRREITHTLSLETENDTDLEDENSEYLGIESGTQEFKTSIIFPPENDGQANEKEQNFNVMRAICAFLNSETGGTLYLGVNDRGYVSGISRDMSQLRMLYIDEYARYIQDCANRLLGKDATMCLQIEPLFNNQCVAVHVKSHPYRVVELDGKAYLRINAESREMTDDMREFINTKKLNKDKDKNKAKNNSLAKLYQAQATEHAVILYRYQSSNSGDIANRNVEAYDILEQDNLIIGYDLDRKEVRVYNLNRIGYVEVSANLWRNKELHVHKKVDDFHMTGDTPIHVSLSLDMFSRNLLIEEFPSSTEHLSQDKHTGRWIYDADVYSLDGITRFYIGLANHIKIIHAPELQSHVIQFIKTIL